MKKQAILGSTIIDGTGSAPLRNGTILIQDGKIVQVGGADQITVGPDAEIIDATGKFTMPGIIDSHVHVTPNQDVPDDIRINLRVGFNAISLLRQSLGAGVTTVVSIGGGPPAVELTNAINEGYVDRCANQITAGVVNASGGHVRGRHADGPWEIRKAVRELASAGCTMIKTAATAGFQWEHERVHWPDYTEEELTALVDEARMRDMPVAAHAHGHEGLKYAVNARVHMIHHGALIDDEGLEAIKKADLYFVPTLFTTSVGRVAKVEQPWTKERMEAAYPIHREGVSKAHKMGIKIALGTDGGAGDAMIELSEFVDCGLSPMDAIVAGTRNTADALSILDRVGTIEGGKDADLLIIGVNPLEDINVLQDQENIELVMTHGKVQTTSNEMKVYLNPRLEGPPRRIVRVNVDM
ncbi:MAG: amidohydrolase family protein [SAR202 cluster bacterium]|nr:amidohydrolase family protein [SAR202 cluster bacterium]|tara:strand:+ start:3954 stop:5186 length:1233 start_codon:yes stop_codon:yes gene_type:complete